MSMNGAFVIPTHNNQPSTLKVVWEYQCCYCDAQAQIEVHGAYQEVPNYPDGWRCIGERSYAGPGHLICPKHTVTILVDGKLA